MATLHNSQLGALGLTAEGLRKWEDKDGNDDHGRAGGGGSDHTPVSNNPSDDHKRADEHERAASYHAQRAQDPKEENWKGHAGAARDHKVASENLRDANGASHPSANMTREMGNEVSTQAWAATEGLKGK